MGLRVFGAVLGFVLAVGAAARSGSVDRADFAAVGLAGSAGGGSAVAGGGGSVDAGGGGSAGLGDGSAGVGGGSAGGWPVASAVAEPRFRWPLDGAPAVVRAFEPPPRPWLPGHRGVDLAGAPGAPVRAAGSGVVRFAGPVAGRGVVSVDHAGGLRTTYEPLTISVHSGQTVRAGDVLGLLVAGHPGCPVAACLHWGLRRGEVYLDPLALVGPARVRLLPVEGRRRLPVGRRHRAGREPRPSRQPSTQDRR